MEFSRLVRGVRLAEAALGSGEKRPVPSEAPIAAVARKSLHVRRALLPGVLLERDHLVALRPGTGLPPSRLPSLIGRRLKRAVAALALLDEADLE
jgi:sialic acid synthase SpsE